MTCKHQCHLAGDVAHARNAEIRHLAEIGELARELMTLKSTVSELSVMVYELERKLLVGSK